MLSMLFFLMFWLWLQITFIVKSFTQQDNDKRLWDSMTNGQFHNCQSWSFILVYGQF